MTQHLNNINYHPNDNNKVWNNLKQFETMKQLKQFETILFPQDMIQDIYVTLEYNT